MNLNVRDPQTGQMVQLKLHDNGDGTYSLILVAGGSVSGSLTVTGALTVAGVTNTGNNAITGNESVSGNLGVTGVITNNNMVSVSTTGTATPGTVEEDTGTITRTIPLASLWAGLELEFINIGSGAVSLTCAQQIYTSNGVNLANTAIVLQPTVWMRLKSDGTNIIQVG